MKAEERDRTKCFIYVAEMYIYFYVKFKSKHNYIFCVYFLKNILWLSRLLYIRGCIYCFTMINCVNAYPLVASGEGGIEKGLNIEVLFSRRLKPGEELNDGGPSKHVPKMDVDDRLCFKSSFFALNGQSELDILYLCGTRTRITVSPKLGGDGPRGGGEALRPKGTWAMSS